HLHFITFSLFLQQINNPHDSSYFFSSIDYVSLSFSSPLALSFFPFISLQFEGFRLRVITLLPLNDYTDQQCRWS
ncbi:unnamed protein product, partial [Brassica rapa subsp. narinosa]